MNGRREPNLKGPGASLLILGAAGAIGAQLLPTTADYSDVLNIGRLQFQLMVFQASLATALLGGIMIVAGEVVNQLAPPVDTVSAERGAAPIELVPAIEPTPEELERRRLAEAEEAALAKAREKASDRFAYMLMAGVAVVIALALFVANGSHKPAADANAAAIDNSEFGDAMLRNDPMPAEGTQQ